jgi:hypothetical protein
MAAGRPRAGRDYAWRGARRSSLRSGDIAGPNTPTAGRWVRAVVTSDGIGGAGGFAGTVPLLVASEGIGGAGGLGGAVPLGDGRGRVVAGPGSGRGAAGSGMVSSLGRRRRKMGGRLLAGAQQGRRRRPAAAAQGGRYRADPVAGAGGCTQAGPPPAASVPLLVDGVTGGSARPGPSRAACGPEVAGLHRVTAAARPGPGPGRLDQAPASSAGTRQCERHGHQRSCWPHRRASAPPVAPGSWPLAAADVRCLRSRYTRTGRLASFFRKLVTCHGGRLDLPDLSRPDPAARGP